MAIMIRIYKTIGFEEKYTSLEDKQLSVGWKQTWKKVKYMFNKRLNRHDESTNRRQQEKTKQTNLIFILIEW